MLQRAHATRSHVPAPRAGVDALDVEDQRRARGGAGNYVDCKARLRGDQILNGCHLRGRQRGAEREGDINIGAGRARVARGARLFVKCVKEEKKSRTCQRHAQTRTHINSRLRFERSQSKSRRSQS